MNSFDRAAQWNSRRYEREFDLGLLCNLIHEEYQEYFTAKTEVDKLDALCDMVFVAYGGIWKSKSRNEVVAESFACAHRCCVLHADCMLYPPVYFVPSVLDAMRSGCLDYVQGLTLIIQYVCMEASTMGVTYDLFEKAMLVVCDSNDTKSVAKDKVAKDVKANIDKGSYFIAPEPRLQEVLDER